MTRIVLRILRFLLIGAAINVAVAWGFVFAVNCTFTTDPMIYFGERHVWRGSEAAERGWPVAVDPSWGPPQEAGELRALGYTEFNAWTTRNPVFREDRTVEASPDKNGVLGSRAGWPRRSLQTAEVFPPFSRDTSEGFEFVSWHAGIAWTRMFPGSAWVFYLPTKPLWGGFVVNSAAYGLWTWMLACGFGTFRRLLRRRRGLCPSCGYPAGTAPRCTECGQSVRPRSAVPA